MSDVRTAAIRHDEVPNRLRALKRRTPRPVKAVARRAVRRYGAGTAERRVLPTFLVIGAKRGGTTSLWNALLSHPGVLPMFPSAQQIKSPHYFDIFYANGLGWYKSHFPTARAYARATQSLGYRPAVGEASPYYLFHPAAPERVARAVPGVKLIVLLRDPVSRAYSNYWERRGSQLEDLPTFREALAAEPGRLAGEEQRLVTDDRYYSVSHDSHSYRARGRYLEQLERWFQHFDRDQFLVVASEQFYAEPDAVSAQVQKFLGLQVQQISHIRHHNRLRVPPMDADLEHELRAYYDPYNQALYERLGVDYGWPGASR